MSKPKPIVVRLTQGDESSSQFTVSNVNEIQDKLLEWHTMSEFETDHYRKKGTLKSRQASGWYFDEEKTNG